MLARLKAYAWHMELARKFGTTFADRVAALRTLNSLESAARKRASDEELTVDILGHPMRGFDPAVMRGLFHAVFIAEEYRFKSEIADPVIIDCGANIGFSVLYFKRLYPEARIHAFEPNPDAFRLLKENVEANELDHVLAHQAALSDHDGETTFYDDRSGGMLRGSVRANRGGGKPVSVEARRLSTLLATLDRADVVKVDVEGGEWDILADLRTTGTLAMPRGYIIEYHHQMPGDSPRLSEFLTPFEEAGYRYQVKASGRDPQAFQDILIHLARDPHNQLHEGSR
jgi:FkbM family methyltransferase